MREIISWKIDDHDIIGTLDTPEDIASNSALIIVSGGNEIRSGSHDSQSQIAQYICAMGHYVLRYDRRGIGDSEGENSGFENSAKDIESAVQFLRSKVGHDLSISAFGNCDAASALLLHHENLGLKNLILANPWTIDAPTTDNSAKDKIDETPTAPSAAAIRARYWARIKNPRSIIDLFTGKIDIGKLLSGLRKASKQEDIGPLAKALAEKLSDIDVNIYILIAQKDTTALAFSGAYKHAIFDNARRNANIKLDSIDSASHSFSDEKARKWLYANISNILQTSL